MEPHNHSTDAERKDAFWFAHDSNARSDPKIRALIARHGLAGYGLWWTLVEILREQPGYRHPMAKPWQAQALASQLACAEMPGEVFLDTCVEVELLQRDQAHIWSPSLLRRMQGWDKTKQLLSEAGKRGATARWHSPKQEEDAHLNGGAMAGLCQGQCDPNATLIAIRGEEIRREDKREEEKVTASLPDVSVSERLVLAVLKEIPGWRFDYATDLQHLRELATDFPAVDPLAEVKKLRDYLKDKPLGEKSNHRLRFRNWCEKAASWERPAQANNEYRPVKVYR